MRLAVLQPGYLPWLGYFEQLMASQAFVHLDDVQYDKHGWRNRNRVRCAGGDGWCWLTVPVRSRGRFGTALCETEIDGTKPWARTHWRTLEQCYGRAPHFHRYGPELRALLLDKAWTRLVELDLALAEWLARCLGVSWTHTVRASALGVPRVGSPTERLVAMCERLGATEYYTGAAARDYLDATAFEKVGVRVTFQDYAHPTYPQILPGFVSHLSALDAVFNVGPYACELVAGARPRPPTGQGPNQDDAPTGAAAEVPTPSRGQATSCPDWATKQPKSGVQDG